jgi:hypothetical protein
MMLGGAATARAKLRAATKGALVLVVPALSRGLRAAASRLDEIAERGAASPLSTWALAGGEPEAIGDGGPDTVKAGAPAMMEDSDAAPDTVRSRAADADSRTPASFTSAVGTAVRPTAAACPPAVAPWLTAAERVRARMDGVGCADRRREGERAPHAIQGAGHRMEGS